MTIHATHQKSGTQVTLRGIAIVRVINGQIVETWSSMDRLGLLHQLGTVASSCELFEQAGLTLENALEP